MNNSKEELIMAIFDSLDEESKKEIYNEIDRKLELFLKDNDYNFNREDLSRFIYKEVFSGKCLNKHFGNSICDFEVKEYIVRERVKNSITAIKI